MLIDLVADRHEIIFQQQRSDPGQLLTRKQLADRIHRRVEHDRAGARRDCCFQSVERQPPVWRIKPHLHRRGTRPPNDGRIAVVSGLEQNDLIARLKQCQKAISERLRGARGDQHLALPIDVEPEPSLGIAGHRLAQRRQSQHGWILMGPLAQRADCGFNQLGRFKANFRKALAEIDRLHFGRKPRHRFKDRRACLPEYRTHHCTTPATDQSVCRPSVQRTNVRFGMLHFQSAQLAGSFVLNTQHGIAFDISAIHEMTPHS